MEIIRNDLKRRIDLIYQFGTISLSKRLRDNWVNNYNLLIKEFNLCNEYKGMQQKKILCPPSFIKDFEEKREKYGLKNEMVLSQIKVLEGMIENVDLSDIPKLVGLKKELIRLQNDIYVLVRDRDGNERLWEISPKDGEEETLKAIEDFYEVHKEFYNITYSNIPPIIKESWNDEYKEYYKSIQFISDNINTYMKEKVDVSFALLPYGEFPTNYPPVMNNLICNTDIIAMFFLPEKVQDVIAKGMRKTAGGKIANLKSV